MKTGLEVETRGPEAEGREHVVATTRTAGPSHGTRQSPIKRSNSMIKSPICGGGQSNRKSTSPVWRLRKSGERRSQYTDPDDTPRTTNMQGQDRGKQETEAQVSVDCVEERHTEVVDLTGEPEIEVVSCTVTPATRRSPSSSKRRKRSEDVHPTVDYLLEESRRKEEESRKKKAAPTCGICVNDMGANTDRPMAAGPCGHVYCKPCLKEVVKRTRHCPTCRKTINAKQIRNIFIDFL